MRLEELNAYAEAPDFWNDSDAAQSVMRERNRLESAITGIESIEQELTDQAEMIALAEAEDDGDVLVEAEGALLALKEMSAKKELESLLSGEADANDSYLEVHAGAGGTESQDWAEMLLRMYTRWSEQHNCKVDLMEESQGEEAGLKSATIRIAGDNAYGWLKTEAGVHRLVRISPYDSASRRHTSFASIDVYPVVDDAIEVDIQDKNLRIDTYRAYFVDQVERCRESLFPQRDIFVVFQLMRVVSVPGRGIEAWRGVATHSAALNHLDPAGIRKGDVDQGRNTTAHQVSVGNLTAMLQRVAVDGIGA